jgi:hypothetical protein
MKVFPKAIGLACALLLGSVSSPSVQADTFALGSFSAPASLSLSNSGLRGSFADTFSFSIDPGASFLFSSFLSTGFSNRSGILDLQADLFRGPTLVQEGTSFTRYLPEGFPSSEVSFASIVLPAGSYQLQVSGDAWGSSFGPASSYSGELTLAAAIPEPETWTLMLLGLAGLGVAAARRRNANPGS